MFYLQSILSIRNLACGSVKFFFCVCLSLLYFFLVIKLNLDHIFILIFFPSYRSLVSPIKSILPSCLLFQTFFFYVFTTIPVHQCIIFLLCIYLDLFPCSMHFNTVSFLRVPPFGFIFSTSAPSSSLIPSVLLRCPPRHASLLPLWTSIL